MQVREQHSACRRIAHVWGHTTVLYDKHDIIVRSVADVQWGRSSMHVHEYTCSTIHVHKGMIQLLWRPPGGVKTYVTALYEEQLVTIPPGYEHRLAFGRNPAEFNEIYHREDGPADLGDIKRIEPAYVGDSAEAFPATPAGSIDYMPLTP